MGNCIRFGYCKTMNAEVGAATTVRYQAMLASAQPSLRSRMVAILAQLVSGWTATMSLKFARYLHVPHRVAGCCGQYFGYSLREAKQCAALCFEEWDSIIDKGLCAPLLLHSV